MTEWQDGDPIDDHILVDFYMPIGRIVVGWADIERTIDICLVIARSKAGAPIRSKGRLTFLQIVQKLRELIQTTPSLVQHDKATQTMLQEAEDIATIRNLIIHGHWSGVNLGPPISAQASNQMLSHDIKKRRDFSFTVADLSVLIGRMQRLHSGFQLLVPVLMSTESPLPCPSPS